MTLDRVNLPALVAQWARFVDDLERRSGALAPAADAPTVEVRLAEFLAEVAVRHEIAQRLRARSTTAETRDLLADLDATFRHATTASEHCAYGGEVATSNGWTPSREWYYWRLPGLLSPSRHHHQQ